MKFTKSLITLLFAATLTACGNGGQSDKDRKADTVEAGSQSVLQPEMTDGLPTIIDFSATWCGPCKMIAPYVHKVAEQNKSSVNFAFIDVDDNQQIAAQYRIEAVPTFVLLDSQGKEVNRLSGADQQGLDALIEQAKSLKN